MTNSDKKMLKERNRRAEKLGEGQWCNNVTKEWCAVDVSFYPTTKLWITENGKRREITRHELERGYSELKV